MDVVNHTCADSLKSGFHQVDGPSPAAIEQKYKILLSGDETLSEVMEMIKEQQQE